MHFEYYNKWIQGAFNIKCKSSRLIHVFLKIFDVLLLPKEHHQNYWKFLQVNNICLKTDTILLQYTFYQFQYFIITCLHGRNGWSMAAATFKVECFLIIVNGFQALTIITKRSVLDVAAVSPQRWYFKR